MYRPFDPQHLSPLKPAQHGIVQAISNKPAADQANAYSNVAVLYESYLHVKTSGTYKFAFRRPRTVALAWLGADHAREQTLRNADIAHLNGGGDAAKEKAERALLAGTFYPVTVLWGNKGRHGNLEFDVEGPDGEILSGSKDGNAYFVTEPCGQ